ncbi:uncharacterized protein KY384_006254 [Bacidia gigantensis]|uniref:uncharacterized protein n=1 Tax=Bacidia gigantensis TaxID=2732470 RepID=UPI001D05089B|nr:uncharacterized protein KY384_006254 [Bacidia gigantensis]KAG8529617.1 hypothetical protein KY384_006254 [Bacidia gigantensis]
MIILPIILLAPYLAFGFPTERSSQLASRAAAGLGVPAGGVVCATANEKAHTLDANSITQIVNQGVGSFQAALQTGNIMAQVVSWPKFFYADRMATGAIAGSQCDLSAGLLYMPISYPGTSAPKVWDAGDKAPVGIPSTDIVVFQAPDPGGQKTADGIGWTSQYCGVLTNSDADTSVQLVVGGTFNINPAGYHQCNNA